MDEIVECDVLVAGSGAAGMTAAIVAASHGLEVLVAEKQAVFGGTTARTAGSMWLPCNRFAAARGIEDSPDKVRAYLRAVMGERFDEARLGSFIDNAPRVLEFFLEKTSVRAFCPVSGSDYHPELPGGLDVGRSLYTEPYDVRELGSHADRLAAPPGVHTFMGLVPQLGRDVLHFTRANRSAASAWHVCKLMARHAMDTVLHGRSCRLTNGRALAGRLLKSALDLGVELRASSPVTSLIRDDQGTVTGGVLDTPAGKVAVRARRGVVLACGGFSYDGSLRSAYFPGPLRGEPCWAATARGADGSGVQLGRSAGGAIKDDLVAPAAWSPMSLVPTDDGRFEVLPLFGGRAVPGVIAVMSDGRRFVNEADAYHDFGAAMIEAAGAGEVSGFLVCDSTALRRYGLGYARPFPIPHGGHVRSGYLIRGRTLRELAQKAGIDADGLAATVRDLNRDALEGSDTRFGKGSKPYNRRMGDELHKPHPCIGPIDRPPYYAIRVVTADIGTYIGLSTDGHARVLDDRGRPVRGLYAAGNDMASIFGGYDPAGGTMLGPAVTFGYIAARHLAGRTVT